MLNQHQQQHPLPPPQQSQHSQQPQPWNHNQPPLNQARIPPNNGQLPSGAISGNGMMVNQAIPSQNQQAGTAPPPTVFQNQFNQPDQGIRSQAQSQWQSVGQMTQEFDHLNLGTPHHNQLPSAPPIDQAPNVARTKRPARAFHSEQMSTSGSGLESPMPPRADLNTGQVFRHRPDRPEHLQYSQHRPMPVVPPGPPLPTQSESGIPPLPRSGGQRPPGPRNRIDPNQIPSPVVVHEQDCEVFENEAFRTCQFLTSKNLTLAGETLSSSQVPLSLTDYVAIDEGNCTPRFIRATTYSFPETEELARAAELPLGLIVQPLAELGQGEGECVPLADFGEDPTGPPRCSGCRGYINPCCTFTDGGQRFRCNLCGKPSDVPSAYFCHLDMSGRRLDHYHRPELCRGSVDFIVNKEYWVQDESSQSRTPKPMKYLFAIDVSWSSIKSGMLKEVTRYIKRVLFEESIDNNEDDTDATGLRHSSNSFGKRKFTEGGEVGFVTFDRTVHFYNLKGGLEQAQMLVVPDLEDMFVPIGEESLFVNPQDSKVIIENLLDSLPSMFEENQIIESAIGGPVQAALSSLRKLGGQVNVFLTSLPTIGPGALKQREETKLYNTDKEHTLFNPSNPWYRQVAEECSLAGIGINLFLFPSQYIDVATLSVLSGITGGEVFFYPRFTPQRDGCKLESQIRRVLTRETACSVTMRIRCSNGVRVSEYFGSFLQRNVTDLEFGNIDSDKAIAAIVKLDGRSESKSEVHFQCALLYTSSNGQRRVRCHNLTIPVTSIMGNVFRSADMDATITAVTKQYITQASQSPLKEVRATLTESCVKVLLAYRKHCASSTSPGQLILPESFKLFPLYSLGLMKTKALKGGNVSSDVRTYYMRYLRSMGAGATLLMIYPRMVPIHQLSDEVGSINPNNGRLKLAPLMRASYLRMEPDGAYLLENGDVMLLWLGNSVSPQIINDLFGVRSLEELEPTKNYRIPRLNTKLSEQVRTLMKHYNAHKGGRERLNSQRGRKGDDGDDDFRDEEEIGNCLMICRQNVDSSELEFANLLVEDQNNDAMSYVDYLCFVHKQIQNELSSSGGGEIKSFDNSGSNFDPSSLWRAAW